MHIGFCFRYLLTSANILGLRRRAKEKRQDWGSIRSSPRDGLTTPCRLIIRNMGDLRIVLPALNLSNLNAGILMMMQQVRLMMFSLNMVDYSMSFLLLST